MTTKDNASPAASANGPKRCSPSAVPITIGISGRTQGDSAVSNPASSASPILAMRSDRFYEQGLDRAGVGIASRAAGLLPALEHDQGALLLDVELSQQVLLRI